MIQIEVFVLLDDRVSSELPGMVVAPVRRQHHQRDRTTPGVLSGTPPGTD